MIYFKCFGSSKRVLTFLIQACDIITRLPYTFTIEYGEEFNIDMSMEGFNEVVSTCQALILAASDIKADLR